MPEETSPRSSSRRPLLLAGLGLLLVLSVIVAVVMVRGAGDDAPTDPAPTTAAPTPPPFPEAPVSTTDRVTLTVPQEVRFAENTFWARAGTTYLVTMDLTSTKPDGSGGRSMYLGVTLSCSPSAGGPGISEGGTQNMLTGEETIYRNQGLVTVPEDGPVECSLKANAPYDDVASKDTTFTVAGTWRAEAVGEHSAQAPTDDLPRTIAAGDDPVVLSEDLPLEDAASTDLRAFTSLHLTTCTGVNGSRENGRAWCSQDQVDETGSTATVTVRAELLDADGKVCAELGSTSTQPDRVDRYRHHRLLSLELEPTFPADPCGDTVRFSASVANEGPAPLVVHQLNSTLVVAEG